MFSTSDFPAIFSMPGNFSLDATAFKRAALHTIATDHTVRDTWEKVSAATFHEHGFMCDRQMLRVHYRQTRRGPTVVKFYFFEKLKDGENTEWACVGETGPRNHINAPMESDDDIRWH
jgi:hypothetical protein